MRAADLGGDVPIKILRRDDGEWGGDGGRREKRGNKEGGDNDNGTKNFDPAYRAVRWKGAKDPLPPCGGGLGWGVAPTVGPLAARTIGMGPCDPPP